MGALAKGDLPEVALDMTNGDLRDTALPIAKDLSASKRQTDRRQMPFMLASPRCYERQDRSALSTGRCNTLAKSLCRGLKVQRFSWPLVELTGDAIELCLRVRR